MLSHSSHKIRKMRKKGSSKIHCKTQGILAAGEERDAYGKDTARGPLAG